MCLCRILRGSLANGALGWLGERCAERHLRRSGLRFVARNVRRARGEIDLIFLEGETVVFVEVKSRTARSYASGIEKIDRAKRRALRSACRSYLAALDGEFDAWRVDAVSVDLTFRGPLPRVASIEWHPGILDLDAR